MGAVFALASATIDFTTARPEDVAEGKKRRVSLGSCSSDR
jgi:hypothetical protein